jgi:IS5 family transposase
MKRASELVDCHFTNHSRRAKRRAMGIENAKKKKDRVKLYKDLLKVARRTVGYAQQVSVKVRNDGGSTVTEIALAMYLANQLDHFVSLANRVISQTERRVFHGERVPAEEKLFSIFEPHTDIVIKDRRETLFGHKVALSVGASGMVLDCVVQKGNPADSTLAVSLVERQKALFGRVPRQTAFDGGFASKKNLAEIKSLGVEDVAFSKRRSLAVNDMVKSMWVYRRLRRFRAGIEGIISFLKRCFGFDRCTWSGLKSFKAYAWGSIISANLLLMARHLLQ